MAVMLGWPKEFETLAEAGFLDVMEMMLHIHYANTFLLAWRYLRLNRVPVAAVYLLRVANHLAGSFF
jgi:hypothetical protein